MVIRIKPEKIEEYRKLHDNPWPEVVEMIKKCKITNYSIFFKDDYLFGYWEYSGNDFRADMAKMASDPITQKWWELTNSCQIPLDTREDGEWWAMMEEVFYVE